MLSFYYSLLFCTIRKILSFIEQRTIRACVHTYEGFDFNFQPSINKKEIEVFMSLRFMENNENILFAWLSGTGKTHLATAIGIEAAKHRKSVYFITCQELMIQLKKNRK